MTERLVPKVVLAVLPAAEDRSSLNAIFRPCNWKLRFTCTLQEACDALHETRIHVVISEGRLGDGHSWRDLLLKISAIDHPPPLIVADRHADEALWAEVLNMGGYDLLVTPFDAKEVLHVVNMACGEYPFRPGPALQMDLHLQV